MLELALVRFAIELVRGEGHEPVVPPVLVREEALVRHRLPARRPRPDLRGAQGRALPRRHLRGRRWPALHADQILDAERAAAPLRGFSTCFRREAGAAGRDTRGIFRVHQFDKVEMFSFVEPSESAAEHERLLAIEERILSELEIPYRVVNVAVGDLGAPAAKKYDCEAWIPSQERYRELTSCSNTTDYQARRLGCRYRPAEGESPQAVHTLNGTAVAVGRTMIALIENRQERDGGFTLPNILHAYGAPERIGPDAWRQAMSTSVREAKRVVLCDDHEIVREAIKARMANSSIVEIVGEAGNGRDVVDVVKELEPDVLIIDVELPKRDGIEATKEVLKVRPADQGDHLHRPRPARPAGAGAARRRLRLRAEVGAGRGHRPGRQSGDRRRHLPRRRLRRRQALRGRETARPLAARAPDPRAAGRGPAGERDRRAACSSARRPSTPTSATRSPSSRSTPAPRRWRWRCASATWARAAA